MKVAQSCLTLCDPMDYRVLGILQARILEQVDFPFSRGSSQPRDQIQASGTADSLLAEPQGGNGYIICMAALKLFISYTPIQKKKLKREENSLLTNFIEFINLGEYFSVN